MTVLLRISDRTYAVEDGDVLPLEVRLLSAVRSGGDFLDLVDTSAGPVRVLVTAASVVWWQEPRAAITPMEQADVWPDLSFLELP